MKKKTFNSLLVGAGFLAGTVGVKALTSKTARKCYVQGVAKGLQVKQGYQNIVEEAKARSTTSLPRRTTLTSPNPRRLKLPRTSSKEAAR